MPPLWTGFFIALLLIPIEIRSEIAVSAASLTNEQLFKFRQSDVIRPAIGGDGDRMAAMVVRAIDQQPANAIRRIWRKVIFCGRFTNGHP